MKRITHLGLDLFLNKEIIDSYFEFESNSNVCFHEVFATCLSTSLGIDGDITYCAKLDEDKYMIEYSTRCTEVYKRVLTLKDIFNAFKNKTITIEVESTERKE